MEDNTHEIFDNNDILIRIFQYLGPRHVFGIGSTNHKLRQISKSDALWKGFWEIRCLYTSRRKPSDESSNDNTTIDDNVHKAAYVFRHAIFWMNLRDKLQRPADITATIQNNNAKIENHTAIDSSDDHELYKAYIQKHTSMKLSNLRVEPFGRQLNTDKLGQSNLRAPLCNQTWPGQLSLAMNNPVGNNTRITCLNPAEAWCDYPSCSQARCGPQGCLRCYRFLPRDYALSATGQIQRECSDRNYNSLSFVKCSWCSVSYCSHHLADWYKCDECNLQSCRDCISQVFQSPPDMKGCNVVTAGDTCRRMICAQCTWYVGKKKQQNINRNIPGGNYKQASEADIVTIKGSELITKEGNKLEWEEVDTCCSKCLRHVEFRLKELEQMNLGFGGLMP